LVRVVVCAFRGRVGVFVVFGAWCEEGVFDFPDGGFGADGEFEVFFLFMGGGYVSKERTQRGEKKKKDLQ
jgi:hypothetical protein